MSQSVSNEELQAVFEHVFMPLQLPQKDAGDADNHKHDVVLCDFILNAAQSYGTFLTGEQLSLWNSITRMLRHLRKFTTFRDKERIINALTSMGYGDVCAFHIRAHNAGLIVRKRAEGTIFEAFEVSPQPKAVMATAGKLICTYPGPAVQVPLDIATNGNFIENLAVFLVEMDLDPLDAMPTTTKARSTVAEERDTADPRYISHLLMGILRGLGDEVQVQRITKRIGDDVLWNNAFKPWRRSPLWLVIRVATQTSVIARHTYKAFMIFFQSQLLRRFLAADFSADSLSLALKKTSRRVFKLGSDTPPFVMDDITATSKAVNDRLQEIWAEEQANQAGTPSSMPNRKDFAAHIALSLPNSRAYLTKVLQATPVFDSTSSFEPSELSRVQDHIDFYTFQASRLLRANRDDGYIALADFESLVHERLEEWVTQRLHDSAVCSTLGSCLDQYIQSATTLYRDSPEDESIMLLTIMELWVALDKTTVAQIPLLRDYSPEIPSNILEPLLLRRSLHIDRAAMVERYLRERHAAAVSVPSIFSSRSSHHTFAVRYFNNNSQMYVVKRQIEDHATAARERKVVELARRNETHASLVRQARKLDHEYAEDWRGDTYHRKNRCERCSLEREANSMKIEVHEWPLPDNSHDAKTVIFEIQCPRPFSIWRDQTYRISRDIAMDGNSKPIEQHGLADKGLSKWSSSHSLGRVTIASSTKSFTQAHYHTVKLPSRESQVCVNNGLTFQVYDQNKRSWIEAPFSSTFTRYCVLQLPSPSPYTNLQHFIAKTTHTSNDVIASQADCPDDLSVHEYISFGTLRSGGLLQWLNVVRELRADILSFSREEVQTLIAQAIWQLGPLDGNGSQRVWHHELEEAAFGIVLTQESLFLSSRVESNWLEGVSERTIIFLMIRLLASSRNASVHQAAYAVLRKARDVAYTWIRELVSKLQRTYSDDEVHELQIRLCEMAATCKATYDVDPLHIGSLLQDPHDVAILVECSAILQSNAPPESLATPLSLRRLLNRDRRLSQFLEPFLYDVIRSNNAGLNKAVSSLWETYRCGVSGWRRLPGPNSRWLTSSTASDSTQRSQVVHFNMLNGLLLIDGKALDRLPRDIVVHPLYIRLFSQRVLDIVPSDMAGMDFTTRGLISNHKVSFALRNRSNTSDGILTIRAQSQAGEIYELIPHEKLACDFPRFFSLDCVHWMNLSSGDVEFRALNHPWDSSVTDWKLRFSSSGRSTMECGPTASKRYLVDVHSKSFKGVFKCLSNLESSVFVTVSYSSSTNDISIDLPRFRLSFTFDQDGHLLSQNMPGMIVDDNQSSGTMIGLRTQLLLRAKEATASELPRSRCVIVPHGDVVCRRTQHHVVVHIRLADEQRRVIWHEYRIDSDLGYLASNVSLTSRLFKIYLQAICSYPLPDPLTQQTGTEQALRDLCSAASFCFQQLTETDAHLLNLIRSLAPPRVFYPSHLRVMQTIHWSPYLPSSAQLAVYEENGHNILRYAHSLEELFAGSEAGNHVDLDNTQEVHKDPSLLDRGTRREHSYGLVDDPTTPADTVYQARDIPGFEAESPAKYSHLVCSWPTDVLRRDFKPDELMDLLKSWGEVAGNNSNLSLTFSGDWLKPALPSQWIGLYNRLRTSGADFPSTKFKLIFNLAALSFGSPHLQNLIPILLAFACLPEFRHCSPPTYPSYHLSDGFQPTRDEVRSIIASRSYDFEARPNNLSLTQGTHESTRNFYNRRLNAHESETRSRTDAATTRFMDQWPSPTVHSPFHSDDDDWFQTGKIMSEVGRLFESCSRNTALRDHINRVESILRGRASPSPLSSIRFSSTYEAVTAPTVPSRIAWADLLMRPVESTFSDLVNVAPLKPTSENLHCSVRADTRELSGLLAEFRSDTHNKLRRLYGDQLDRSRRDLEERASTALPSRTYQLQELITYRELCQSRIQDISDLIIRILSPTSHTESLLSSAGLWPRLNRRRLLQLLAVGSDIPTRLGSNWRRLLSTFAHAILEYQRAQRLVEYTYRKEEDNFSKELVNCCMTEEQIHEYPLDWLLIQIDGNFLARPVQIAVAREMMTPTSEQNTVLQLNMGEGKSSVIVPFISASLADSRNLVRVVVLKALSGQMFQLLVERLSGLTNRRIFYVPFSRGVRMTTANVQSINRLFQACARVQGVLVSQPEHILSLRLMAVERLLSPSVSDAVADGLRGIEAWLKAHSRDILDESDEILHVKYQLVYTNGHQQSLENSPDRWNTTQQVFDRTRLHASTLNALFPHEVEFSAGSAEGFPTLRITGEQAGQKLVSLLADDILAGRLETLNLVAFNGDSRLSTAARELILDANIAKTSYDLVQSTCSNTGSWATLLLLRGLLSNGILLYALGQRRWRVDYGLDPSRSMLAVPYRAKDVPTLRAEFGHPEVAICLTCLSYYYGGLSEQHIRECFHLLFKLDNPQVEYEGWVRRSKDTIPDVLRQITGVNTQDAHQFLENIVPLFSRNQAVIDFFLSRVVFPKHAKEFPEKLSTSAWDLAEIKSNVTTGFSGTNDNSLLLPTSIEQHDPLDQLRTNAQVLMYLLQPENSRYQCTSYHGQSRSAVDFLKMLVEERPEVRVLLDVGAQMLELKNEQLIRQWLALRGDVLAGVYFDESDRLTVLTQDGTKESLVSSPFRQQLGKCIIYLDDAHTRGTDLRLPVHFRAAVTLGPKVTKDRLVQGCMRMRKLGVGQSVMFCAPLEVDRRIREAGSLSPSADIKVLDVLRWSMSESCSEILHNVPHWAAQGMNYEKRMVSELSDSSTRRSTLRETLRAAWLQPEVRTLEQLYGLSEHSAGIRHPAYDVPALSERFELLGVSSVLDARIEEEQEREVSQEVEQERQIERPPRTQPAIHSLQEAVRRFVVDGSVPAGTLHFVPLMQPLRSTRATLRPAIPWSSNLLATQDFATTTSTHLERSRLTEYLRPVNWVVSAMQKDGTLILVAMSPYEVNLLLPQVRASKAVHLHLYAPRVTLSMEPIDNLGFYCVPPTPTDKTLAPPPLDLRCQLNVWAGQLYLDEYATYIRLCLLLGVSHGEASSTPMENDRFVRPQHRNDEMRQICLFEESPVALLKELFGLRRKGMSYARTDMGKLLQGRLLFTEDFESR